MPLLILCSLATCLAGSIVILRPSRQRSDLKITLTMSFLDSPQTISHNSCTNVPYRRKSYSNSFQKNKLIRVKQEEAKYIHQGHQRCNVKRACLLFPQIRSWQTPRSLPSAITPCLQVFNTLQNGLIQIAASLKKVIFSERNVSIFYDEVYHLRSVIV